MHWQVIPVNVEQKKQRKKQSFGPNTEWKWCGHRCGKSTLRKCCACMDKRRHPSRQRGRTRGMRTAWGGSTRQGVVQATVSEVASLSSTGRRDGGARCACVLYGCVLLPYWLTAAGAYLRQAYSLLSSRLLASKLSLCLLFCRVTSENDSSYTYIL